MILIAWKGHRLMHIPQPIHKCSEMKQMVEEGFTSMHIFPILLIGQVFAHSYLHFFGLHLSGLMIAILSLLSAIVIFLLQSSLRKLKNYSIITHLRHEK